MARPEKATAVAELAGQFRSSTAALLTEYRGLSVAQLQQLRRSLGENAQYAVVKNTLTKIAAKQAGLDQLETLLEGPSAIAFVRGDPVEAAKSLRDFSRANPMLVIKGGVLEGRALSPDEIRQLADLESREVLLARLAGALLASLSQAASLFQAPLSQAARAIEALRQKAAEDPSILPRGSGSTAAADTDAAPPPTAEGTAEGPAGEAPAEATSEAAASEAAPGPAEPASEAPTEAGTGPAAEAPTEAGTGPAAEASPNPSTEG